MDRRKKSSIRYKPLDAEKEEIRVLSIEPSKAPCMKASGRDFIEWKALVIMNLSWKASAVRLGLADDPIHCTLETVSLKDINPASHEDPPIDGNVIMLAGWRGPGTTSIHPRDGVPTLEHKIPYIPRFNWGDYEALSYTWGNDKRTGKIYVNGAPVSVQLNVEKALRRLRAFPETHHGMKYWIDAISINQSDIQERNEQVKKMQDIYGKAWSVAVWLGDEGGQSNEAIDFISGLAHLSLYSSEDLSSRKNFDFMMRDVMWNPLLALFSRPYWQRVWIIQELATNRYLTVFLCGDRAFYREELEPTLDLWYTMMTQSFYQVTPPRLKGFNGIRDMFNRLSGLLTVNVFSKAHSRPSADLWSVVTRLKILLTDQSKDLTDLLSLSQQAAASDDRDKIYGILGLLPPPISSKIVPNYDDSTQSIYLQFARIMLETQGLDELLAWASGLEGRHKSWMPDWTLAFPRNHIQWLRRRRACGTRQFSSHITQTDNSLHCEGFVLGTVTNLTINPLEASDLLLSTTYKGKSQSKVGDHSPDHALRNVLNLVLLMEHPGRSKFSHSLVDIPWEGKWNRQPSSGYEHAFDKFRKSNANFLICGHELQHFFPERSGGFECEISSSAIARDLRLGCVSLVRRRLFTTETGLLGLAPDRTEPNDIVAILGCRYPVILRPKDGYYHFVGECYVHGIMDGEAADGAHDTRDGRDTSVQKFILR